jgi:DNA polymerase I-like protein with 3'-5' exonuclease and polymerase domains
MVDFATISAAIGAATSAVGLIDKMADQIERFISKSPEPVMPKEHRMKINGENDAIVSREHGQVTQTITADDLQRLPESQLRHITVLEKSMENHYSIWEEVYPNLALLDSVIQKAKVEKQLEGIIKDMKGDLEDILSFLESCGLYLDDHYQHIRYLIKNV